MVYSRSHISQLMREQRAGVTTGAVIESCCEKACTRMTVTGVGVGERWGWGWSQLPSSILVVGGYVGRRQSLNTHSGVWLIFLSNDTSSGAAVRLGCWRCGMHGTGDRAGRRRRDAARQDDWWGRDPSPCRRLRSSSLWRQTAASKLNMTGIKGAGGVHSCRRRSSVVVVVVVVVACLEATCMAFSYAAAANDVRISRARRRHSLCRRRRISRRITRTKKRRFLARSSPFRQTSTRDAGRRR